jgi:oligopeptide/dipeptide ABC transporter ATP-binding protein
MTAPHTALLRLEHLSAEFPTERGIVRAVESVDLDVAAGECLGVVGESGSGKSATFQSVLGILRPPGRISGGRILFEGRDLAAMSERELIAIRGREIAMTMQDALTALNPVLTIGTQIGEVLLAHAAVGTASVSEASLDMLRRVGIPEPEARLKQYPHELSGGMRQRVMIAIALACRPKLLIADEPTSALDVTIQAQILDLIDDLRRELGMAVVLITHDLAIVAERCDRVAVMYAGQVVETGRTEDVVGDPVHPYTRGLIGALPKVDDPGRKLIAIEGRAPELNEAPAVCRFLDRCPRAADQCRLPVPLLRLGEARLVRCVRAFERAEAVPA